VEASFAGPLPPPDLLRGYEEVCPGAADRIIAMAERQAQHRQALEKSMLAATTAETRGEFTEARTGQICGLAVALAFIAAGTYVAATGNPWPGALIGGGGVGLQAMVAIFVRGRAKVENQVLDGNTDKR
jgi:uncharacterized membrane protein